MARLFVRLVWEMFRNRPKLNDDLENNFLICKKICQKVVRAAGIEMNVSYAERVPTDKKFLMVSNHRCFFDVVFLLACLEEPVSFVAAKELWHYPLLHRYLDSIFCIALDRNPSGVSDLKSDIMSMREALMQRNVVLFPEGECSYYEEKMQPFKKGGFLGITGMDVNIIPVFLKINEIHNIGRWMIPKGEVAVYVGSAFQPEKVKERGNRAGRMAAYAQRRVEQLQREASGEEA